MGLRANFDRSYLWRYWVIILMALGSGAWFFYDATIGYPKKVKIAKAWEELDQLESGPRAERWRELAAEKGWPQEVPVKPSAEIEESIRFQYIYGSVASVVGALMLVYLLIARNAWVEETDTGLTTSWGQQVDFSTVTRLNKRRWADKGIARADYVENGRKRQFVFDDFKYERTAIGKLLERLENQLPADQVIQPAVDASAEKTNEPADS
jgi:hypothetical protein